MKSSLLAAVAHALRGGRILIATQRNARIHAAATAVTIVAGLGLRVTAFDWALLTLAIAMVWLAEALNTAIEFLADEVTLERRERIKHAKDVAAFAVLSAAIGAVTIATFVFVPYLTGKN